MQYNQEQLIRLLCLAGAAIATGALVVYEAATHGALLSYIQDLQEGGSGPIGFTQ